MVYKHLCVYLHVHIYVYFMYRHDIGYTMYTGGKYFILQLNI